MKSNYIKPEKVVDEIIDDIHCEITSYIKDGVNEVNTEYTFDNNEYELYGDIYRILTKKLYEDYSYE